MPDLMRICKILPVADGLKNWGHLHEELLAEIAHDSVEVVQFDLPDVGVTSISGSYDSDLVAPAHTRAAIRAEADGFDAVAMGCLCQPGVAAAREVLNIPVVGETNAAMHLASLVAPRFSFLVPGAFSGEADRIVAELARQDGFADQLASVRRVSASSLDFSGEGAADALVSAMLAAAEAAISQDGAQAIIGYGGRGIYRQLRHALPVPVISPIQASVIVAEMLVRAGIAQSKLAYASRIRTRPTVSGSGNAVQGPAGPQL